MKSTEILDGLNALLIRQWPERTVYVDVCPVDFERPSFWLAVEKNERRDAGRFLVRRDLTVKLTIFDAKDEHYESSWYRLAEDTDLCAGLFSGVLAVGGRTLKLTAKGAPRDPDRAYLMISTSWMEPREQAQSQEPAAEHYHLSVHTDGKKIYETELIK